jgi:uncharacterized protein (DUF1800 family)
MELHTLGVNSGYTQQDVQQLSLILTGAGVVAQRGPNVIDGIDDNFLRQRPGVVRDGLFIFTARPPRFLQQAIPGSNHRKAAASMKSSKRSM